MAERLSDVDHDVRGQEMSALGGRVSQPRISSRTAVPDEMPLICLLPAVEHAREFGSCQRRPSVVGRRETPGRPRFRRGQRCEPDGAEELEADSAHRGRRRRRHLCVDPAGALRANHSNSTVLAEPRGFHRSRVPAAKACFDCHRNLTSGLGIRTSRRSRGSCSATWTVVGASSISPNGKPQDVSAGDAADAIRGGSMPPGIYTLMHPNSRLTSARRSAHQKPGRDPHC